MTIERQTPQPHKPGELIKELIKQAKVPSESMEEFVETQLPEMLKEADQTLVFFPMPSLTREHGELKEDLSLIRNIGRVADAANFNFFNIQNADKDEWIGFFQRKPKVYDELDLSQKKKNIV